MTQRVTIEHEALYHKDLVQVFARASAATYLSWRRDGAQRGEGDVMHGARWICVMVWAACGAACSGHGEGPYSLFTVKERGERYENVYQIEKYDEASEDGRCVTHRDELRMGQLTGSESGGHFVAFDAAKLEALTKKLDRLQPSNDADQDYSIEVTRYEDYFNIKYVIQLNLDNTDHASFLEQVKQLCRKRWPAPT